MTRQRKFLSIPFCQSCYHCLHMHGENRYMCAITAKTIEDRRSFDEDCPMNDEKTKNGIAKIIFKNLSDEPFDEITASEKEKLYKITNEILDFMDSFINVNK